MGAQWLQSISILNGSGAPPSVKNYLCGYRDVRWGRYFQQRRVATLFLQSRKTIKIYIVNCPGLPPGRGGGLVNFPSACFDMDNVEMLELDCPRRGWAGGSRSCLEGMKAYARQGDIHEGGGGVRLRVFQGFALLPPRWTTCLALMHMRQTSDPAVKSSGVPGSGLYH